MDEQYGAQRGRDVPEVTESRPESRFAGLPASTFLCPDIQQPSSVEQALRPGAAGVLIWAAGRVKEGMRQRPEVLVGKSQATSSRGGDRVAFSHLPD